MNHVVPTVDVGARKETASSLIQSSVVLTDHSSIYERPARHAGWQRSGWEAFHRGPMLISMDKLIISVIRLEG
jgi:hypothetical protein